MFTTLSDLTPKNLAMQQWRTATLLNMASLHLDGADATNPPLVDSVIDIGMNFMTPPEILNSGCDADIVFSQAKATQIWTAEMRADDVLSTLLSPQS